jgi:hypothetical protein
MAKFYMDAPSATTTEAVRRAIQHSHVWTALADQGFSVVTRSSRVPSCPAFCCGTLPAGPDGFRWFVCLIKRTSLALRLCSGLPEPILACLHHNVVTLDS